MSNTFLPKGRLKKVSITKNKTTTKNSFEKVDIVILKKQINKTIKVSGSYEGNFGGYELDFVFLLKNLGYLELVVLTAIYPCQEFLKWHLKIESSKWIPGKAFDPESGRFL